jgi:PAS domain S-box-containing protein
MMLSIQERIYEWGWIVLWNCAAEKILGYTGREAVGRPCCDLFVGRDGKGNRLCYTGAT